ncbi:hypothetical protein EDD86DRAFT_205841 [Gorgonomyces haynaldii]|nr:hypothetical protein EDD86DRAFT_205841 [Gorgonomyces haynaldii]
MEQQALEFVLTENHIVTFRSLSRHLGITVNESKQLLESIAEKNKLHCVCQVFEHNKDGIAIHIRKGYLGSEIGHVWAVAPFEVNDFDAILNIDQQVSLNDTPESQQASRVISNDGIIIGRSSRKPIEAAQPKTATKKSGSKQEDVKGSENTSEPRAADPKPKKQSLSSFFGQRAKERKESKDNEEVTVKKVKPSVKPKDKPVEKPSESLDKPVEKQAEKKAEKPSQKVINRPVEKPAPVVQIVSAKSKEQADQIKKLFDEEPQVLRLIVEEA